MKKLTLTLIAVLAVTLSSLAQTPTELAAMASTVNVRVSTATVGTNKYQVYTVMVPVAVNTALSTAKKAKETDEIYVRRAFVYGAAGLIAEKNALILKCAELKKQQVALTNVVNQINMQLK